MMPIIVKSSVKGSPVDPLTEAGLKECAVEFEIGKVITK